MKRIEIYIGLSVFALSAKSQVKESRPNVIYIIMADPGPFDSPTKFVIQTFITVGGVSGWAEILQRMRVGERWLVYIPWELAYGASGTDDIPGYSTLIFDMQLEEILDE